MCARMGRDFGRFFRTVFRPGAFIERQWTVIEENKKIKKRLKKP